MFLSGSRLFGGARQDSDWDYIEQDSPKARMRLDDSGFQLVQNSPERFCHQVWRLDTGFGVVEVKLVEDEQAAWWMQEWILRSAGRCRSMRHGSRPTKRALWVAAHRAYESHMDKKKIKSVAVLVGKWGWRLLRTLQALKIIKVKEIEALGPAVDSILEGK